MLRILFYIGFWAAIILSVTLLWGVRAPVIAIDGAQIAQKVFDRDTGKDATAGIRMLLIDKKERKRFRTLTSVVKEYGDVSKSYMRFASPADIAGTTFLTWENKGRDDDQFLYLPALRRVRRIVVSQKAGRFVNTDYTYEDLQVREVEKDTHTVLKEENVDQYVCWVLESVPRDDKESQYGKRLTWIIKDIYLPIKTEFYDKRGKLKKVLLGRKIKKIDGIWTILEAEMKDLKKKHRTLMKTDEIKYNQNVSDKIFTKGYMKHTN